MLNTVKLELTPAETGVMLAGVLSLREEGLIPQRMFESICGKVEEALSKAGRT